MCGYGTVESLILAYKPPFLGTLSGINIDLHQLKMKRSYMGEIARVGLTLCLRLSNLKRKRASQMAQRIR